MKTVRQTTFASLGSRACLPALALLDVWMSPLANLVEEPGGSANLSVVWNREETADRVQSRCDLCEYELAVQYGSRVST